MAVRNASGGVVHLLNTETVIGVVLKRDIQNGVRVRPTNVTATIDLTDHDGLGTIGAAVSINAGATGTLTITTTGDLTSIFSVGEVIRIAGVPLGSTTPSRRVTRYVSGEAAIATISATTITFTVSPATFGEIGGLPIIPTIANENIVLTESSDEEATDLFIVLHNGPAGGFSQQLRVSETKAYPCNDVIQSVITDA